MYGSQTAPRLVLFASEQAHQEAEGAAEVAVGRKRADDPVGGDGTVAGAGEVKASG